MGGRLEDELFTEEEKRILGPFVTNLDKRVFVLKNLPEVIKGALFSRYSRTTKGLRRLLLDEFIKDPEVGFKNISAFLSESGNKDLIAIEKAQDFYNRILDGYGDDSVAELGGAHVAIENISNLATKTIQDCRIGGSPLEKSSRYVWFNKKIKNDYVYYHEPVLMGSEFKELYLSIIKMLFEAYDSLIEPMKDYFIQRIPRDPETPDVAYNFSIRAKACDTIRGLLPVATKTNMGVFGNGRFFEYLIIKLRSHPLREMQDLADELQEELNKVVPSFVRRCQPDHRHFGPFKDYLQHTRSSIEKWQKKYVAHLSIAHAEEVELIDHDIFAEEKVLSALLYEVSHVPMKQLRQIIAKLSPEERHKLLTEYFDKRTNRRNKPPRAFENASFTFDILADFGNYRDLHRHRMLTQERQEISTLHGFDLPPDIVEAGFEAKWVHCMEKAKAAYEAIVKKYPREAQYVVPFAFKVRWYVTLNARSVYWLSELRSSPQGHPTYRRIAQKMYVKAREKCPLLLAYARFVDMNDYSLGRLQAETRTAKKKETESINQ